MRGWTERGRPFHRTQQYAREKVTGNSGDTLMVWNDILPEYFCTMQAEILASPEFERGERERTVCAVNDWPRNNCFRTDSRSGGLWSAPCQVIGVALAGVSNPGVETQRDLISIVE